MHIRLLLGALALPLPELRLLVPLGELLSCDPVRCFPCGGGGALGGWLAPWCGAAGEARCDLCTVALPRRLGERADGPTGDVACSDGQATDIHYGADCFSPRATPRGGARAARGGGAAPGEGVVSLGQVKPQWAPPPTVCLTPRSQQV